MPQMNGTGPEGKGPKSGRRLGRCKKNSPDELLSKLGKGQGKRRNAGHGQGEGKRLRSGKI
jgi:hypothetical protein